MDLRRGIWWEVEEEADRLIMATLRSEWGGGNHGPNSLDVITQHKAQVWRERHVMVPFADAALYKGIYRRAANDRQPWLNSRDGHTRGSRFEVVEYDIHGGWR